MSIGKLKIFNRKKAYLHRDLTGTCLGNRPFGRELMGGVFVGSGIGGLELSLVLGIWEG